MHAHALMNSASSFKHTQAMAVLNHAGISLSYDMTWIYLKKLIEQANYTGQVKQGRWLWVYDNFNMHQTIRHERQGNPGITCSIFGLSKYIACNHIQISTTQ